MDAAYMMIVHMVPHGGVMPSVRDVKYDMRCVAIL
jgi:hypothetical protein